MIAANVKQALSLTENLDEDPLPAGLREENGLCSRRTALENIHFPKNKEALAQARNRLMFEELFYLNLALGQTRRSARKKAAVSMKTVSMDGFYRLFPFTLTGAHIQKGESLTCFLTTERSKQPSQAESL